MKPPTPRVLCLQRLLKRIPHPPPTRGRRRKGSRRWKEPTILTVWKREMLEKILRTGFPPMRRDWQLMEGPTRQSAELPGMTLGRVCHLKDKTMQIFLRMFFKTTLKRFKRINATGPVEMTTVPTDPKLELAGRAEGMAYTGLMAVPGSTH